MSLQELLQQVAGLNTPETKEALRDAIKILNQNLSENKELQKQYNSFTENMKNIPDIKANNQHLIREEIKLNELLNTIQKMLNI